MRIMIDTNIIISLVVFNSHSLKKAVTNICYKYQLVLCTYIIDELNEVVKNKFPSKQSSLDDFLSKTPFELQYTPKGIPNIPEIEMRDEKDKPILYSAIIANVDILITGDKDFHNLDIEKPEIISANEFLNKF